MIGEESDRWVVRPRQVLVTSAESQEDEALEIHFETDLHLEIVGQWLLARSVKVAEASRVASVGEVLGSRQASLVLFDSGSIRLVFSNGMVLRSSIGGARRIRCYRPGDFEWDCDQLGVTRSRSGPRI